VDKDTYVCIFCTLRCNFIRSCTYCIQRQDKCVVDRVELPAKKFIAYAEQLPSCVEHIGLTGGEPTLYYYFFELLAGLSKNFKITVTTNVSGGTFNFNEFLSRASKIKNVRWNTTLHMPAMKPEVYADRIIRMKETGLWVDQVTMPFYRREDFIGAYNYLNSKNIFLRPQTLVGVIDGNVYPSREIVETYRGMDTGIDDWDLYEEGFTMKRRMRRMCRTNCHIIGPDGYVYRCHSLLYAAQDPMFHIGDGYKDTTGWRPCNNYGHCNPCQFKNTEFKGIPQQIEREGKKRER
jgi:organic radical activating enzyme